MTYYHDFHMFETSTNGMLTECYKRCCLLNVESLRK